MALGPKPLGPQLLKLIYKDIYIYIYNNIYIYTCSRKTYLSRVPYHGFYIYFLKNVSLLGHRWGIGRAHVVSGASLRALGLGFSC